MKRHPSLEPLSRDHNEGLILARRLTESERALDTFRAAWERELRDHFAEEERLLLPLCDRPSQERLLREHAAIASLGGAAATPDEARRLGELLHDHIRWEERELFVTIEQTASEAALRSLGHATNAIEKRRAKANPLRAELVARRPAPSSEPDVVDLGYLARVSRDHGAQWGTETEDLNATLLTWSRGEGIAEHINHEVDVLIVVLAGIVEVTLNGTVVSLEPSQMLTIPKGATRSLTTTSDRAAHLNVHKRRRKLMPTVRP